jgi:hypothetical protein
MMTIVHMIRPDHLQSYLSKFYDARGDNHLVHEAIVANGFSATETISNMPSFLTIPATLAASLTSSLGSTSANTCTCVSQAYSTTFGMPSSIKLSQFDGSNWSNWLGELEALLILHEAKDIFAIKLVPSGVNQGKGNSLQRRIRAYLCLYVRPNIFSLIISDAEFLTFKDKWDKLKQVYGNATSSTTIFNLWIQLIQACLNDSLPMSS